MESKILTINDTNYKINTYSHLADGSHLSANEIELETPIQISNKSYTNLLIKSPLNNLKLNDSFLNIYSILKKNNIPTYNFFIKGLWNEKEVFVTENLNFRKNNVIYVSSNYHPNVKFVSDLNGLILSGTFTEDNLKEILKCPDDISKEHQLYNNKIELQNFDYVINLGKSLSKKCTLSNIFFPDDSLFYGVNLETSTVEDILIGDFDCISFDSSENNLIVNLNSFKQTFMDFLTHFVKDSDEYITNLKNKNLL